jgi:ubiquinone/menaquinone biosynthesis C-methylase UbiE
VVGFDIKNARSLTIADIAKEALQKPLRLKNKRLAPLKSKRLKTKVADVMDLPFAKNKFDTVVMATTAHHLSVRSLPQTKRNINKFIVSL